MHGDSGKRTSLCSCVCACTSCVFTQFLNLLQIYSIGSCQVLPRFSEQLKSSNSEFMSCSRHIKVSCWGRGVYFSFSRPSQSSPARMELKDNNLEVRKKAVTLTALKVKRQTLEWKKHCLACSYCSRYIVELGCWKRGCYPLMSFRRFKLDKQIYFNHEDLRTQCIALLWISHYSPHTAGCCCSVHQKCAFVRGWQKAKFKNKIVVRGCTLELLPKKRKKMIETPSFFVNN